MKRPLLITGIAVGALLTLGPFIGMLLTFFGMHRAFQTLERTGMKDPGALSADIGTVLYSTAAGLVALPVGLIVLSLCIVLLVLDHRRMPPPLPQNAPAADNSPTTPK